MGVMIAMTAADGDIRVPWDPNDPNQIEEARQRFRHYKAQGYRAFGIARRGARGEEINDFDPSMGEILFAKTALQGG